MFQNAGEKRGTSLRPRGSPSSASQQLAAARRVREEPSSEWQSDDHIIRVHATVCHGDKEWARDDDGDGLHEVHVNTSEGMWTTVHNFLRPFRGVHKKYLGGYVAICEFSINLKRITPAFISALVTLH